MNSRTRINIGLFFLVAILMAILFFDTGQSKTTTYRLTSLNETTISTIEITRLTAEALKFIKTNNIWYMLSPYRVRANTFYIESLLRISQAQASTQYSINNSDKNKFKLNPPQASLKLNDQLFLFGSNEQLNLNRYILTNNKLYLLPDRYFYILNSSTTGFIDHALIGKKEKITGIKLENYQVTLLNSNWSITPRNETISTDDIVQLVSEWNNSQAIEISKLTKFTATDKIISIEVKLKNKTQAILFDIVKTENEYVFIRSDLKLQYKLNSDMANRLLKLPN